jgi:hypothetical protein
LGFPPQGCLLSAPGLPRYLSSLRLSQKSLQKKIFLLASQSF